MTDEELKELVAANSVAIGRLEALSEATDRRWRDNDRWFRQMRDESERQRQEMRENDRRWQETRQESERRWQEMRKENERQWQEMRAEIRASRLETDREIRASREETDRVMRAVHRDLGRLSNKFGHYTEDLCRPALERILRQRFHMTEIAPRVRAYRNGKGIELDMLAHANDRINQVYLVEIKTSLGESAINQILDHLRVFPEFFPQHCGKELYGILAVVGSSPELEEEVFAKGIYLVLVSEDTFDLLEPEGFRPRIFPTS